MSASAVEAGAGGPGVGVTNTRRDFARPRGTGKPAAQSIVVRVIQYREREMNRRHYLKGSLSAGLALLGTAKVFADDDRVIEALKQAVGARSGSAGMVAILIDESGERLSSYGSSGRE